MTNDQFIMISRAFVCSDASLAARAVYMALMLHADQRDDAREVWPSYERIMECSGIRGKATISTALAELEAKGWIARRKRFSGATVYSLARDVVASSSKFEPSVVQNLNHSSSEIERLDNAPVVQNLNHSSSKSELPVVQKLNPNKNKRTRTTEKQSPIVPGAKRAAHDDDDASAFWDSLGEEQSAEKEVPSPAPIPDQTRDESTTDAPAEKVKRSRKSPIAKVRDALSEADKQRRRELFDAVAEICVLDPKACGARIGRTVKYLFEATATAGDVKAFLTWWSENEYPGKLGKPPAPERVTEKWKQFRDGWAEHPRMTKGEATSVNRMARIYSDAVPQGEN